MSEVEQVDPVFRGLNPELIEKLCGAMIATCDQFLSEVQCYQTMSSLIANRKGSWPVAVTNCNERVGEIDQEFDNSLKTQRFIRF